MSDPFQERKEKIIKTLQKVAEQISTAQMYLTANDRVDFTIDDAQAHVEIAIERLTGKESVK